MKIAIISDSHDNVPNLEKALDWINSQGISLIIHCGDLSAPSMLAKVLAPNFKGKIHLVHGNVGDPELLEEVAKKFENVHLHGKIGELVLPSELGTVPIRGQSPGEKEGVKIAFTHFPAKAKELAKTGKYDLVFYGHTHKPWEEKLKLQISNCKLQNRKSKTRGKKLKIVQLVNPGTLAGMFYKATFATYDTENDELELKILEKI